MEKSERYPLLFRNFIDLFYFLRINNKLTSAIIKFSHSCEDMHSKMKTNKICVCSDYKITILIVIYAIFAFFVLSAVGRSFYGL